MFGTLRTEGFPPDRMIPGEAQTITRLLRGAREGQQDAREALVPLVYDELRSLAEALFVRQPGNHTLQPTALVHEAWAKLAPHLEAPSEGSGFADRRHFYVVAARAMRQVLTDYARRARSQKRGGERLRVTLDENLHRSRERHLELVELDDALERLASLNERHARVVELRFLGGLTIAETAAVLDVSHATVEDDWFTARAWLRSQLASS